MSKAIRDAYGEALVALGKDHPNVVVLDADVSSSTKTAGFAAAYPDRFFNVGIAESNMTAMAAGMASAGLVPFVNTFAIFIVTNGLIATRELIAYTELNVKLMGAYGGLSDAFDGPTHHSIEDIAIMRSLPNMQVFCPCDEYQTAWLVRYAAENPGAMYIRLSRDAMPVVYSPDSDFQPGKGHVVRPGKDATVFACGIMVGHALQAAEVLAKEGIDLRVVDMFSIKPLDEALVLQCAAETGAVITAEEHSVLGGLGGAVAEAMTKGGSKAALTRVGVQDCFSECGPYDQLLHKYGLDAQAIADAARKAVQSK